MTTQAGRALGVADTIARLLTQSATGYTALEVIPDGPLFAKVRVLAEDGTTFTVTVER